MNLKNGEALFLRQTEYSQSCVKKMLIFCLKHADVLKKYADVFLKVC